MRPRPLSVSAWLPNKRTWVVAFSAAALSALLALYVTRPVQAPGIGSLSGFAGRDHPSLQSPDPLTPDEAGYQVPRDRIKAIDAPAFIAAASATHVPDAMHVIGVAVNGESRAYPVAILSRAEIVNDQIRGRAIAVTW